MITVSYWCVQEPDHQLGEFDFDNMETKFILGLCIKMGFCVGDPCIARTVLGSH